MFPASMLANRRGHFAIDSSEGEESEEMGLGHQEGGGRAAAVPVPPAPIVTQPTIQAPIGKKQHYVEKFTAELKCPLCRKVLEEPVMVSVECMHRFCGRCIDGERYS